MVKLSDGEPARPSSECYSPYAEKKLSDYTRSELEKQRVLRRSEGPVYDRLEGSLEAVRTKHIRDYFDLLEVREYGRFWRMQNQGGLRTFGQDAEDPKITNGVFTASTQIYLPDYVGYFVPRNKAPLPAYLEVKVPSAKIKLGQELLLKQARDYGCISGLIFTPECAYDMLKKYAPEIPAPRY